MGEPGSGVSLGAFQVEELLGAGGFGRVWRGRHRTTGAQVALKVVPWSPRSAAVQRELRAVARLDHPHIVALHAWGAVPESAAQRLGAHGTWLALELAGDGRLDEARLESRAIDGALLALVDALGHAHARGVLHLDVKGANVLLDRGRVLLADFGIARLGDTGTHAGGGSPRSMAPEQWQGRTLGPWTDLYALGCLAHELWVGRPAFPGPSADELRTQHIAAPLPPLPADLSRARADLLEWLLEKNPHRRARHAADVRAALMGAAGDEPHAPRRGPRLDAPTAATMELLDLEEARTPSADDEPGPQWTPALPASWSTTADAGNTEVAAIRRRLSRMGDGTELLSLRILPCLGRHGEKDQLWRALGRASRDGPRAVLIEGPSGSGCSHLGHWLVERATELGAGTLWDGGTRPSVTARLLDEPDPGDLQRLLREVSTEHRPELVVVALRDGRRSEPALAEALGRLERSPRVERIALGGMRDGAFQILLGAVGIFDRADVARIGQAASWLPGLALTWVSHWLQTGALLRGPDGIEVAGRLEPPGAELEPWSRLLAVLEREAPEALQALTELACLGPSGSADGDDPRGSTWALLSQRGYVRPGPVGWRLASPALAVAVQRATSDSGAWARASDVLAARADGVLRARLLLQAGRPAEALDAALALLEAPVRPGARYREAQRVADAALVDLGAGPDDSAWRAVAFWRAWEAMWGSRPDGPGLLRAFVEVVGPDPPGVDGVRVALLEAIEAVQAREQGADAGALLLRARTLAEERVPESRLAAFAAWVFGTLQIFQGGDPDWDCAAVARRSVALGLHQIAAAAWSDEVVRLGRRGDYAGSIEAASEALAILGPDAEPAVLAQLLVNRGVSLLELGDLDRARADLERSGHIVGRLGLPMALVVQCQLLRLTLEEGGDPRAGFAEVCRVLELRGERLPLRLAALLGWARACALHADVGGLDAVSEQLVAHLTVDPGHLTAHTLPDLQAVVEALVAGGRSERAAELRHLAVLSDR